MAALLAEFANAGYIDLKQPEKDILAQLKKVSDVLTEKDLDPVIDHTESLLSKAREAHKAGDLSIAVLMYATYVEHTLNLFLMKLAEARDIPSAQYAMMIREASLRAKSTWLLPLLGSRPLSELTITRIQRLAEARNAFIHYKWNQKYSLAKADQNKSIMDAEKVVLALQRYKLKAVGLVSRKSHSVQSLVNPITNSTK